MFSLVIAIASSFLLLLGTPAASPDSAPQQSYAEMFADIRAESTNPVVLEVIADDRVTDDEADLLVDEFLTCMSDAGFPEVEAVADELIPGSYRYIWSGPGEETSGTPIAETEQFDKYNLAFGTCMSEWGPPLAVRDAMLVNPNNEDIFALNLECLQTYDLVPDDFDYADLEHAAMTADWGPGVEPWTKEFTLCLVNPLQVGLDPMPLSAATPAASPGSD